MSSNSQTSQILIAHESKPEQQIRTLTDSALGRIGMEPPYSYRVEDVLDNWISIPADIQSEFETLLNFDCNDESSFYDKFDVFFDRVECYFTNENYLKSLKCIDTQFYLHYQAGRLWRNTVDTTQKYITPIALVGLVATSGSIHHYAQTDGQVDWQSAQQTDVYRGNIKINSVDSTRDRSRFLTVDAKDNFKTIVVEFDYDQSPIPIKVELKRDLFSSTSNDQILNIDLVKIASISAPTTEYSVKSVKIVQVNY
jgi:hypothetical protein